MSKAIIINGGYSLTSRITGVEQEIKSLLKKENYQTETIVVHQLNANDLITANYNSEEIKKTYKKIAESEIVFVLTPIFKGSYSGILKTYLDVLPRKALQNKAIIPVAIGGSIAHLLALEYSLKPVLSILGATNISAPIYVIDAQVQVTDSNKYNVAEEVTQRLQQVWQQLQFEHILSV